MSGRRRPNHWRLLIVLALGAGIAISVGIWLRTLVVDDRTYRLCERIHSIAGGGETELEPGDPGFTYYTQIAPDENEARVEGAKAVAAAFGDCESFR